MMMLGLVRAVLLLCLWASGARAQDIAFSPAMPPRLALFVLAYDNLTHTHNAIDRAKRAQGLGGGAYPYPIDRTINFTPLLYFDANINGGTPGDTVMIGGLPLVLAQDARAVQGMMAGGQISLRAAAALGHGRVVSVQGDAAAAQQIGSFLRSARAHLQLCGAQYLGAARWFDICAAQNISARALVQTRSQTASAALAQQFKTQRGYGQLGLSLRRQIFTGYALDSAAFTLTLADEHRGLIQIQTEVGAPAAGQMSRMYGASASVTQPIWGAQTTVFAQFTRDGGGEFFGQARQDTAVTLGMTRPFGRGQSVTLTAARTLSNISNFTDTALGLAYNFAPRRF